MRVSVSAATGTHCPIRRVDTGDVAVRQEPTPALFKLDESPLGVLGGASGGIDNDEVHIGSHYPKVVFNDCHWSSPPERSTGELGPSARQVGQ